MDQAVFVGDHHKYRLPVNSGVATPASRLLQSGRPIHKPDGSIHCSCIPISPGGLRVLTKYQSPLTLMICRRVCLISTRSFASFMTTSMSL